MVAAAISNALTTLKGFFSFDDAVSLLLLRFTIITAANSVSAHRIDGYLRLSYVVLLFLTLSNCLLIRLVSSLCRRSRWYCRTRLHWSIRSSFHRRYRWIHRYRRRMARRKLHSSRKATRLCLRLLGMVSSLPLLLPIARSCRTDRSRLNDRISNSNLQDFLHVVHPHVLDQLDPWLQVPNR